MSLRTTVSLSQVLTLGLAVSVAVATWERGQWNQFRDGASMEGEAQIRAWAAGTGLGTEPRTSRCGIFSLPQQSPILWQERATHHHPLLNSYLAVLALRLGASEPSIVPVGGAAAVTSLLVLVLGWRRWTTAAPLAGLLLAACWWAPGYGAWLASPISHAWGMTCVLGLLLAILTLPWWGVLGAVFVTAWLSIEVVSLHAAMVAAALVVVYGMSRRTLAIGLGAMGVYLIAWSLHVLQLWCHYAWDWAAVRQDYFLGAPGSTSFWFRFSDLGLAGRVASASAWVPQYFQAVLTNPTWTTQEFWWVAGLALLCTRPSARGLLASAIFVLGVLSWFVAVPGLIIYHLHHLPRYLLVVPLGVVALCAAADRQADVEMHTSPTPSGDG